MDDAIRTAKRHGWNKEELAAIGKAADRLVGCDRDRLFGGLRLRHARHAPRRGRAGAADARESGLRHRRRYQPQYRIVRPVAARRRQQSGDAGDQAGQQGGAAPDPVRSCRDRQAFRRDPGVRRSRQADQRCFEPRPGAGRSQRRRIFFGSSRASRHRPLHQQADAAPERLCDRAEPAHHRRRRQLSRRGRGLDPVFLFP